MVKKKSVVISKESGPSVNLEVIPAEAAVIETPAPLKIGQQVKVTSEVKSPRGVMRAGTATVIEGYQVTGGKVQYKVLYRGFRFWVFAGVIKKI